MKKDKKRLDCTYRKDCGKCRLDRTKNCGLKAWLSCEDGGLMVTILLSAIFIIAAGLTVILRT